MNVSFLSGAARTLAAKLPQTLLESLKKTNRSAKMRAEAQSLLSHDPIASRSVYQRLTSEQPDHPIHWIGLGLAEAASGDLQAAAMTATEARRRVASRPEAQLALADLEQRLGRTPEALASLLRGLQFVEGSGPSASLRATAVSYAERLDDDALVLRLLWPLIESGAGSAEIWEKVLHIEMRLNGEVAARRLARKHARRLKDALPLHGLMEVYTALQRMREARLINRYLTRIWPHSAFHTRRYIFELARAGYAEQADRRLRQVWREKPSYDLERDFCELAYAAGEFVEAARRSEWLSRRNPGDLSTYLAWGYALANTEGIDTAERHFGVAAASVENYSALIALAHMAMRRRDRPLTARRWALVSRTFPGDSKAAVEQARAEFDSGRPEIALAICEQWREVQTPNRAVDEFYAWLLSNVGRFEDALVCVHALKNFGPSWTVAEIMVQSSGLLRRLDKNLAVIIEALPRVSTWEDVRHLYAVLRLFEYFERSGTAFGAILPRVGGAVRLDWAWPYLVAHERELRGTELTPRLLEKAHADHAQLLTKVSDSVFQTWASLTAAGVEAILAQATRERPEVHVVNMFEQASGGSELHALDLGERLAAYANVSFWAPEFPQPLLHAERGVRAIDPSAGAYPKDGVLVFVGVYFSLGPWLKLARPSRILVLYNTFDAVRLSAFVRTLYEMTGCKVELLFCSDMMRNECGLPGLFEPSPIDLTVFPPRSDWASDRFIIGRHSRDVPEKHSAADASVYTAMTARGAHVRLLGATCMRQIYPRSPAIELLPVRRSGVQQYLEELDVFYYRTGTWIEPWGRVVIEAMAHGLPVVVHERGGYAEAVQSGVDGFVFRTSEEAIDQLSALQDDEELRRRTGQAARRKVETLLGDEALKRLLAVYLLPRALEPIL